MKKSNVSKTKPAKHKPKHASPTSTTFFSPWQKKLRKIAHIKQIVSGVLALGGLILVVGVVLFMIDKSKDIYTLTVESVQPNQLVQVGNELSVDLEVQKNKAAFGVQYEAKPLLVVKVDDQQVEEKQLDLTQFSAVQQHLQINTTDITEGEHAVKIAVLDQTDEHKQLSEVSFSIIKDTTAPVAQEVSVDEGSTAKISLDDKKNISITDKKANELHGTVKFSESGKLKIEKPSNAQVSVDDGDSQSPRFAISAGEKPFKTTYEFTDQVGLKTSGNFSYYYDNVPPKITLLSPSTQSTKLGRVTRIAFSVNEGLSQSYVTMKGQPYKTSLSQKNTYASEEVPLEVGPNPFTITATDLSGNTSTQSFSITLVEPPKSSFRMCTFDIYKECASQVGYEGNCDKKDALLSCMKSKCDSVVRLQGCE